MATKLTRLSGGQRGNWGKEWMWRTHRAGRMAINPMHTLSTAFKQSESERSMAAKIPIAPGHPLPQVLTCRLRATTIFWGGRRVSQVELWKLANTYRDDFDDDISNRKVSETTGMVADGVGADVDGSDNLGGDLLGALVVPAAAERGDDAVAVVVEGIEGVHDVAVRPLRNDLGDGTGEGHDTSGEDGEDGGETHGEEAGDEERRAKRLRRLLWLRATEGVDETLNQRVVQVL